MNRPHLQRLYHVYLEVQDALRQHAGSHLGSPFPIVDSLEVCGEPLHHLQQPLIQVRRGDRDPWDLVEVNSLCFLAKHECLPTVELKAGLPYASKLYSWRRDGHLQNLKRWRDRVCHPRAQDLAQDLPTVTFHKALEQIQLFRNTL